MAEDQSLQPELRLTFQRILEASTANGKAKLITGRYRQVLEDLWANRGNDKHLRPEAVAKRVYKDKIEKEVGQTPLRSDLEPYIRRLRVAVTDLRNSLALFFDTEAGRRLPFTMVIEEKRYKLKFKEAQPALKMFWQTHEHKTVQIVSTAPLFLRHPRLRAFIRILDINRERKLLRLARRPTLLLKKLGDSPLIEALLREQVELIARRSYTTLGEMEAVIQLNDCLRELGLSSTWSLAHRVKLNPLRQGKHTILLGNVRTNPLTLNIPRAEVKVRQRPRSLLVKETAQLVDDIKPHGTAFGLITRLAGWPRRGSTVVLAANHAPIIGRLGTLVTDEKLLNRMLNSVGLDAGRLPKRLEIVIKFRLDASEQVAREQSKRAFRSNA